MPHLQNLLSNPHRSLASHRRQCVPKCTFAPTFVSMDLRSHLNNAHLRALWPQSASAGFHVIRDGGLARFRHRVLPHPLI